MIIVSQDKKEIINFNNIVSVYVIENYEEKGKYNIDFATTDEINFIIGTYDTEERAKEVLQEIIEEYTSSNSSFGNQGYVKNKVYYMPKE